MVWVTFRRHSFWKGSVGCRNSCEAWNGVVCVYVPALAQPSRTTPGVLAALCLWDGGGNHESCSHGCHSSSRFCPAENKTVA